MGILRYLFLFFAVFSYGSDYLSFGVGPSWLNLNFVQEDSYINEPNSKRKSIYRLDTTSGYCIDSILSHSFNKWLNLYIEGTYCQLKNGSGFIDVFKVVNGKRVEDLGHYDFSPFFKIKSVVLADQINIYKSFYSNAYLNTDIVLGYNYLKFYAESDWGDDKGISDSTYKGFVGALKFDLYKGNWLFSLYDFIFPDRFDTFSTQDSFFANDSAFSSYILMNNNLCSGITYTFNKKWSATVYFNWSYFWNVGNACIELLDAEKDDYKNPRLCLSNGNQYTLLFYVNYNF